MKISVHDKGKGIIHQFAQAIGAHINGRFVEIPEHMGAGYITGFSWDDDLRVMIRNYYLKKGILVERLNELRDGQDDVVFVISGVFPQLQWSEKRLSKEQSLVMISRYAVASTMEMPPDTIFGSITIAASRAYLRRYFSGIAHPLVVAVLVSRDNFIFETALTADIIRTAIEFLEQRVPQAMENYYYHLKCEELLCYIMALLMQREAIPATEMHIDDIKAVYAVKLRLLEHLNLPPDIASLSVEAGMSAPKLRKLFKQTFGKGIFEYYQ